MPDRFCGIDRADLLMQLSQTLMQTRTKNTTAESCKIA